MKIMIMDPQPLSRERVADLIKGQPDVEIVGDGNLGSEMVEQALAHRPEIILMSASLFEEVGKEMMNVVLSENPETAFVILAPTKTRI